MASSSNVQCCGGDDSRLLTMPRHISLAIVEDLTPDDLRSLRSTCRYFLHLLNDNEEYLPKDHFQVEYDPLYCADCKNDKNLPYDYEDDHDMLEKLEVFSETAGAVYEKVLPSPIAKSQLGWRDVVKMTRPNADMVRRIEHIAFRPHTSIEILILKKMHINQEFCNDFHEIFENVAKRVIFPFCTVEKLDFHLLTKRPETDFTFNECFWGDSIELEGPCDDPAHKSIGISIQNVFLQEQLPSSKIIQMVLERVKCLQCNAIEAPVPVKIQGRKKAAQPSRSCLHFKLNDQLLPEYSTLAHDFCGECQQIDSLSNAALTTRGIRRYIEALLDAPPPMHNATFRVVTKNMYKIHFTVKTLEEVEETPIEKLRPDFEENCNFIFERDNYFVKASVYMLWQWDEAKITLTAGYKS